MIFHAKAVPATQKQFFYNQFAVSLRFSRISTAFLSNISRFIKKVARSIKIFNNLQYFPNPSRFQESFKTL